MSVVIGATEEAAWLLERASECRLRAAIEAANADTEAEKFWLREARDCELEAESIGSE